METQGPTAQFQKLAAELGIKIKSAILQAIASGDSETRLFLN
jgi:hypothetical protein